jgi:hypothetical protein
VTSSSTIPRPAAGGTAKRPGGPAVDRPGGPVRAVPRRRLPALIALGMLLILGCAAIGAALFLRQGQTVSVLGIKAQVAQGQVITLDHLRRVSVRVDGSLPVVPEGRWREVVGKRAKVTLLPGTLLFQSQYAADGGLGPGESVVALALKPGQLPAVGLAPGDVVAVVQTPTKGTPGESQATRRIADAARVRFARPLATGDTTVVDLIVPLRDAQDIAQAQALGEASIILLPAS